MSSLVWFGEVWFGGRGCLFGDFCLFLFKEHYHQHLNLVLFFHFTLF